MRRFVTWMAVLVGLLLGWPAAAQFNGPGNTSLPASAVVFPVTTDQAALFPPTEEIRLTAGDVLAVKVLGETEYAPTVTVDATGEVFLPYLGRVPMVGLTVGQAEERIAQGLVTAEIYKDPQVTVQVTAGPNSAATVTGEVKAVVPILGSRPLLQVLAVAGGLPPTASRVITIDRPGRAGPIIVDLGNDPTRAGEGNVPVLPGDTVVISRVGVVYLLGAFKTQGTIALTNYTPLTLTEAAALSSGPAFEAKYDDMRLIRTVGNHRTVVKLDMKRILYGKDPDPILQPNDIVFLPQSAWKAAITNGTLSTAFSLYSVIYTVLYSATH